MESRGARRFETLRIRRAISRNLISSRLTFLQVSHVFPITRDRLTEKWNQGYSTLQRLLMEGEALVENILSRSHAVDTSRHVTAAGKPAEGKKNYLPQETADYREQDHFPVAFCHLLLRTTLFSRVPSLLLIHLDMHKRRNKKPRRTLFATPLTLFIHRYAAPSPMYGVHNERVII